MSGHDHNGGEPVNAPIFPVPPVVLLLFLAAGFLLETLAPLIKRPSPVPLESRIAGGVIIACAIAIVIAAAREMHRARTTIFPGGAAASLVRSGVFGRSRNPIYLAMVFLMLGLGIATASPWLVVLAPALLFYLQERVIKREEAYLTAKFGPEYGAYRRNVRRWF